MRFLETRKGKLEGLVISGGEPTLQPGLLPFIKEVKKLGYLVKLDTNGSRPQVLEELLSGDLLDYVAMDIKAPPAKYRQVTQVPVHPGTIAKSTRLLLKSKIDYEFRTTVVDSQFDDNDWSALGRPLKGARRYILQPFVPANCKDKPLRTKSPPNKETLSRIRDRLTTMGLPCRLR